MRPGIEVCAVRPEDVAGVVSLCMAARQESWTGPQVCSGDVATVTEQLGGLAGFPGGTILVARADGVIVGLLLGRVVASNLFTDQVILAVEAIYVDPGLRRRGVGHALMLEAVELAIAAGAGQVYAAPIPGARGMQRFFVRLGFAPAVAHRVTSTAALHRRLMADGSSRRPGSVGREELIARRRQSRADAGAAVAASDLGVWREGTNRQVSRAVHTRRPLESSTTIS